MHDEMNEDQRAEVPYRNYLQSPLQPLADNLEAATYETFENDTIKYDLYEQACYKAFLDKMRHGKFFQTKDSCIVKDLPLYGQSTYNEHLPEGGKIVQMTTEDNPMHQCPHADEEIVVLYFGAGRGPLIRKALSAAKRSGAKIKVIALDKNPNAIVTLRNMIVNENLEEKVALIAGDMRHISVEQMQGDILMSELLGSFGDNELSPECLIPTQKFLKPGGIYLPWAYTNHVVPLSSQILWNEAKVYAA